MPKSYDKENLDSNRLIKPLGIYTIKDNIEFLGIPNLPRKLWAKRP